MSKQQKLREIINRACPELNEESWQWAKVVVDEKDERVRNVEIVEHPISLEHLLRTIDITTDGCHYLTISSNGFIRFNSGGLGKYNLLLPPLEQEEEVIDSLLEILE